MPATTITVTGEVTRSKITEREAYHTYCGRTEFFADVSLRLEDGSAIYFHTPAVGSESAVPVFEFGTPLTVKGRIKADRESAIGNKYKVLNYVKVLNAVRAKPPAEPTGTSLAELREYEEATGLRVGCPA